MAPAPIPTLEPKAEPTPAAPAPPPTSPHARPTEKPKPVAQDTGLRTEEKRRWGLTTLILVLGAGAVAAARRHR
jgi:hypothetical protein